MAAVTTTAAPPVRATGVRWRQRRQRRQWWLPVLPAAVATGVSLLLGRPQQT
jgi:hypothetical protein